MGTKSTVFSQEIKQKGHFNYREFYEMAFSFLKDKGYRVEEHKYEEKISTDGKEITLNWVSPKKVSDYFKNVIKTDWKINDLVDTEIEIDGKRTKTNKGTVKIKVEATIERDYDGEWDKKPIWKMLRGIYDRYIIRTTIDEYEGRLAGDAGEFVGELKGFLQLGK
jgi:hypothetical protein